MRVSVVINTFNRCSMLERTLKSLSQLRYPEFEVLVVNGPSTDGTGELLSAWSESLRIIDCPKRNLSASRNLAIAAASGDIVAFIDDDAIPDPLWLNNIVAGYDSEEIGAVGGFVYDHTGYTLQSQFIVCDRFGKADSQFSHNPTLMFNTPKAPRYPALLGTNSSFRKSVLIEIGGFDEEFSYYLDETDVCLRMVDSGYVIKVVEDAFVYHGFAPSHLRDSNRVLRDRYEVLKNQAYFSFKHGALLHGYGEAVNAINAFVEHHRRDVVWCTENNLLPPQARDQFEVTATGAIGDGIERVIRASHATRSAVLSAQASPKFKRFGRESAASRLTICLVSQQYPPGNVDGIGRFTHELARALAKAGQTVHVVTRSSTHNRVDLEEGVWVHRIHASSAICPRPDIPPRIWDWSMAALAEIKRIHQCDHIDLVQAPAWDCEGVAVLFDGEFPLITSIHTPMLVSASMHPDWMVKTDYFKDVLCPIIEWERRMILFSDGIYANSAGIIARIEADYLLNVNALPAVIIPHGLTDRVQQNLETPSGGVRILYIGRLEPRKGIDVLLSALAVLLPDHPDVEVDIVGEDIYADGEDYETRFRRMTAERFHSRVRFYGRVEQEYLDNFIRRADIFVAPSRFESFGLVFVEAMMHARPVVGCSVGGICEVVEHEVTGLLVPPGNSEALAESLTRLIASPQLRVELGAAGRRRYEERFTAEIMAARSLDFYHAQIARWRTRQTNPNSFSLTRLCTMRDFWVADALGSSIEAVAGLAVDYLAWGFCIGVEAARRISRSARKVTCLSAAVVSDRPPPKLSDIIAGWDDVRYVTSSTPAAPFPDPMTKYRSGGLLGLSDRSYELVLCIDPIDLHAPTFRDRTKELQRACKPGGTIIELIALRPGTHANASCLEKEFTAIGLQVRGSLATLFGDADSVTIDAFQEGCDPRVTKIVNGERCVIGCVELVNSPWA
jgi:glycosyltransferase involved in cell wall biosynthesis